MRKALHTGGQSILIAFTLTVFFGVISGQPKQVSSTESVNRIAGETAEDFAKRNGPPGSELAESVIETNAWGKTRTVIAFYVVEAKLKDGTRTEEVDGYIFIPKAPDLYQRKLIHRIGEEGARPEIRSVFFANANKDRAKELVLIVAWRQYHYDFEGTLYGTFVFDDVLDKTDQTKLKFLERTSNKVSGGCHCSSRDGTRETARFRTAKQVRAGLRALGFR